MATSKERDFRNVMEKLDRLSGVRGDTAKSQSAVRRSELYPLASITLSSKQVTAAPTQAEYNALQSDVAKIFNALKRISNILGNATLPEP